MPEVVKKTCSYSKLMYITTLIKLFPNWVDGHSFIQIHVIFIFTPSNIFLLHGVLPGQYLLIPPNFCFVSHSTIKKTDEDPSKVFKIITSTICYEK